jgi:hypothetical protein
MSIAEESLHCAGLFEAELLVELMLRFWHHPRADDSDYRNHLLENAVEALRLAVSGQGLLEGIAAADTNLVAAIWYVEWQGLANATETESTDFHARQQWLETVRRALPSCFCDPEELC